MDKNKREDNRQWLKDLLETDEEFEDGLLIWMARHPLDVKAVIEEILLQREELRIEKHYEDNPLAYKTELGQEVAMQEETE